ncbi:DUF4396 domain-containing protein [Falsirhodobacter algicola]|uniref:DUF4396 domain-containing protein n=1 Tax=Falsirhodobacter algicola TaxID=2692330 RepID=A0A8J8MQN1_9RHOB|nr:DUF4396 domain-containing protein [Falsirhodobacter algicola]QUS34920.1 DUF4396 domain-containing protein [Falsirhodobacter algicola]
MPDWLHTLSILSLLLGLASAVIVLIDGTRRMQHMAIMKIVWPLVALFGGLFTLAFYWRYGRGMPKGHEMHHMDPPPFPVSVAKGAAHCGAGCALGDMLAEGLALAVPGVLVWMGYGSLFEERIFATWVLDFIFAFGLGVVFQYFAIAPMRDLSPGAGIRAALKADTLSLTSWQVGMYAFMALAHFWLFGHILGVDLPVASAEFWFMMQIAMLCGFATSYPVNWWLIRKGIKERM